MAGHQGSRDGMSPSEAAEPRVRCDRTESAAVLDQMGRNPGAGPRIHDGPAAGGRAGRRPADSRCGSRRPERPKCSGGNNRSKAAAGAIVWVALRIRPGSTPARLRSKRRVWKPSASARPRTPGSRSSGNRFPSWRGRSAAFWAAKITCGAGAERDPAPEVDRVGLGHAWPSRRRAAAVAGGVQPRTAIA